MRRIEMLLSLLFLVMPHAAPAVQLHWASGGTDLSVEQDAQELLIVQADSSAALPGSWLLQWTADSTGMQFLPVNSELACQSDTAEVVGIELPETAADSAANRIVARFCSAGTEMASTAYFLVNLRGASRGQARVVTLNPEDSTATVISNEVTFNGGVGGDYAPIVLRAFTSHPGAMLQITAVGAGLKEVSGLCVQAADATWNLPLSLTETSDTRAIGTAYLAAPLPSSVLQVKGTTSQLSESALSEETLSDLSESLPAYAKFIPAYGVVYPKDFAFIYQQKLGIFHIFYIVSNEVITNSLGPDSTERTLGHAWSPDLVHWHHMDSVLTVRAGKFDNLHVWAPTIIQKDLQFKLFYTGVGSDLQGNPIQRIGLATADATLPNDSLKTWTRRDSAVFSCAQVPWANKNTSLYDGRQFRDPFVMADPDSAGRYLMYYVTIPKDQTTKMVVGVARSAGDLTA